MTSCSSPATRFDLCVLALGRDPIALPPCSCPLCSRTTRGHERACSHPLPSYFLLPLPLAGRSSVSGQCHPLHQRFPLLPLLLGGDTTASSPHCRARAAHERAADASLAATKDMEMRRPTEEDHGEERFISMRAGRSTHHSCASILENEEEQLVAGGDRSSSTTH